MIAALVGFVVWAAGVAVFFALEKRGFNDYQEGLQQAVQEALNLEAALESAPTEDWWEWELEMHYHLFGDDSNA